MKSVKALGYACQNTLSQKPKNLTLGDQENVIKRYVREKDWELVDIFRETTSSNNATTQPILEKIISEASEKKYDILVIARLDRLTRDVRVLNTLISEVCMKNGIHLLSIEEEVDTRTECGQLALKIIDIVTKWDTKRISDRTREIIARKRAIGERVGHAPFGHTYKDKRLVPVEAEMDIVRLIRVEREKGLSYHKIAKYLNDRKIASKRGGIWYAETVKTVYQNSLSNKLFMDYYLATGRDATTGL